MAKNVSNNDTLEVLRTSYNDLVDEVGGLGGLRTSQKSSLVDSINSIIDQYFFFQDFEFTGSNGTSSNRTFSGTDNFNETLKYSVNRLLVFKNGTLLRSGTDYSATNGSSITLASSAANSDIIRITSFTGSYEGVAGATQGAVTQWTKTGAGSIYNHDTENGVVINSDATGIVTAPASGYGIQLESSGSNIFLNTGSTSNEVFVNGNLNLTSGGQIKVNGSQITASDLSGFNTSVRNLINGDGSTISYNPSTGVISATGTADTTGNAATATTLQTARTIHGVSFNGSADIDLTEQIQDTVDGLLVAGTNMSLTYDDASNSLTISSSGKTQEEVEDIVGAMFSSNTETGITVTYQDSDGTLDLVIGDDAIVSSMIANNTIVGGNIAANSIGSSEIAPNAINASELADDAVDTDAIVNNAVTLGTKTSGNYVGTLSAGTGLSSTGATSGEGIAHQISLDDTAVTAGSYGSASAIPTLTVDAQGRITSASQTTVDTYSGWSQAADTGTTKAVSEGTTITIAGGEGMNTSISGSTVTVAGEDASTSNKGIASFSSTDFTVSSGAVSIDHESIEDIVGGMISGSGATSVSYNDGTGTLTISSTDNNDNTVTQVRANSSSFRTGNITLQSGTNVTITEPSTGVFNIESTDTNTTYSVTDGQLSERNFTSTLKNKLDGIAAGATNTAAPFYTSAIGSSDVTNALGFTPYSSANPSNFSTYTSNQATNTNSSVTFAQVSSTGDIIAYASDDRLKDRGDNIENALEKVESLNGFHFNWNDTASDLSDQFDKNVNMVGVSAQEVAQVLPEVVQPAPVDNEYKTVQYEKLVPLLIEAIKELKSEIESLKS